MSRPSFYTAGLLFAYIALALVLPARDFGQRDQLLSFLILPYVLSVALPGGFWLRVIAGGLATVGICLKPQYAVIPLVLEGFLLLAENGGVGPRLRHLVRVEVVLIVAGGVCYLTAIRWFAPLYFSQALPVLRETYWAVGHLTLPQLLVEAIELVMLALAAVGLYFVTGRRSRVVLMLLVAGTAALLAYLVQGTGWYYQQIPGLVLFGVALALQLMELMERQPVRVSRWVLPVTTAVCLLAVGLTTHFMGYPFTAERAFAIEVPEPGLFASLAPGTPVAMLTTSVDATMMPVERYHLTWAQRTNNLWTLPAILRGESGSTRLTRAQIASLTEMQQRWMVEDLERWRPSLVLVQRCQDAAVRCQLLEDRSDNLLAWFERDPAFAALWKSYRLERRAGPFDVYVRAGAR